MILVGFAGLAAGIPLGVTIHQAWLTAHSPELPWRVKHLEETYTLSTEQVRLVRAVLLQRERETRAAYTAKHALLPAELLTQIEDIKRKADERIEAVLDSGQRAKYRKDLSKVSSARK